MAHDPLAAADFLIINDRNAAEYGHDELFDDAPLLASMTFVPASNGTVHKWTNKGAAPTVGIRDINAGRDVDSPVYETLSTNLGILDASFDVDIAGARSYKGGTAALLAMETVAALRALMFKGESVLVYGNAASPTVLGLSYGLTAIGTYCLDAGGTTAATGSSVFMFRSAQDGVAAVFGNNGEVEVGEAVVIEKEVAGGGSYPAYYVPLTAWFGTQYGSGVDVVRIANLTEDSGHGLTDDLLYTAFASFRAGRPPTHIAMSRRSARQLQNSRTAYSPVGAPAEWPRSFQGIPIIITDAIVNTETLLV